MKTRVIIVLFLSFTIIACVSKSEYDLIRAKAQNLTIENEALKTQATALIKENIALKSKIAELEHNITSLRQNITAIPVGCEELATKYSNLVNRTKDLEKFIAYFSLARQNVPNESIARAKYFADLRVAAERINSVVSTKLDTLIYTFELLLAQGVIEPELVTCDQKLSWANSTIALYADYFHAFNEYKKELYGTIIGSLNSTLELIR